MADIHLSQRKSKQLRQRSSSYRNLHTNRQQKNNEYFGSHHKQSVIPTLTAKPYRQHSATDYELTNTKHNDNQYIKSLYKKYLGKENQHRSDRKQRVQSGVVKNLFGKEQKQPMTNSKPLKDSLVVVQCTQTQQSHQKAKYEQEEGTQIEYSNSKYSMSKHRQVVSAELPQAPRPTSKAVPEVDFYSKLMDEQLLEMMGPSRSSLILCLKSICNAKKLAKLHL